MDMQGFPQRIRRGADTRNYYPVTADDYDIEHGTLRSVLGCIFANYGAASLLCFPSLDHLARDLESRPGIIPWSRAFKPFIRASRIIHEGIILNR
jgi:hypothetical protein